MVDEKEPSWFVGIRYGSCRERVCSIRYKRLSTLSVLLLISQYDVYL